ncbi:MAG: bacteriohemerythrin [Patescibacteria group bacterium]
MEQIIWKPNYSVNVKEIDEQHQNFVHILDTLYDAIQKGEAEKVLNDTFAQLMYYKEFHFATEEKYFDEFNYEGAEEHKKAHQDFRNAVAELQKKKDADHLAVSVEILDFMENWLVEHLSSMDKKYTKCFNEHGLY